MSLWRHVQSGPRHRQQETTLHEAYCPSISLRKRLTTKRSQTKAEHTLKGSFITPVFSWIVGILHPTLCALAGAGTLFTKEGKGMFSKKYFSRNNSLQNWFLLDSCAHVTLSIADTAVVHTAALLRQSSLRASCSCGDGIADLM